MFEVYGVSFEAFARVFVWWHLVLAVSALCSRWAHEETVRRFGENAGVSEVLGSFVPDREDVLKIAKGEKSAFGLVLDCVRRLFGAGFLHTYGYLLLCELSLPYYLVRRLTGKLAGW